MLVGRSLEVSGNAYSRLMIEADLSEQNPAYRFAFFKNIKAPFIHGALMFNGLSFSAPPF